jgi:hypothetical protein
MNWPADVMFVVVVQTEDGEVERLIGGFSTNDDAQAYALAQGPNHTCWLPIDNSDGEST